MPYEHRGKTIRSLESDRRFNPAMLSGVELDFVADHLGESPAKALKDGCGGANLTTVRPVLEFFFDLIEGGSRNFIGIEEFRARLVPWKERCELIKQTSVHNGGAQMPVELFAKQGSRYVRGGRGSDFGHVRRHAFDFIDDALPGTLEDALGAMSKTAEASMAKHEEAEAIREAKRRGAEESGVLASDRFVDGEPLFDDSVPGRLACVAEGCGYQKEYEVSDSPAPRRKAITTMLRHASGKYRKDDTDAEHKRIYFGLKQG